MSFHVFAHDKKTIHAVIRSLEAISLGWERSRDPDTYNIWHSSKTNDVVSVTA